MFTGAAGELPGDLAVRVADPLAWPQTLAHLTRQALTRIDQRGLQMHRLTQAILRGSPLTASLMIQDCQHVHRMPIPAGMTCAAHRIAIHGQNDET